MNKNVILFIDEIHGIVGAGNSQGSLDAANILKPALSRSDIQCIGATTYSEYKKYIEKDPALARRFQSIQVFEPSIETTKLIIQNLKKQFEKFHHIKIDTNAINLAVELSVRYITDRFLPDKALDILDESASALKNKNFQNNWLKNLKKIENEFQDTIKIKESLISKHQYEKALKIQSREIELSGKITAFEKKRRNSKIKIPQLSKNEIIKTISKITGIPETKISSEKISKKVTDIEKVLNKSIIGQEESTLAISNVLLRSYSGISNPDRPAGSFLFLGPTGVGKTMMAKLIAKEIFSNENSMIKIDMSEFSEKHTLARLVGAPAGYIGYGEGGTLTEKVRRNPYGLILFDEIEKAHPDVLNILLQILEDGILTDAEGRAVSFKNSIIILTSNISAEEFGKISNLGFQSLAKEKNTKQNIEEIKQNAIKKLFQNMKTEIINRLDHVLVFNPLNEKDIEKITQKELGLLSLRLQNKSIKLSFDSQSIKFISKKSNSHKYGARLIRKNIQDIIETKLAKYILNNPTKKKLAIFVEGNNVMIK